MSVLTEIEYWGCFEQTTHRRKETIEVSDEIEKAVEQVKAHLRQGHGIHPPYMLMFENSHMIAAIKKYKDTPIKSGAVFKVMPVMSGG